MSIFKAYDIRGTLPDQITETVAFGVGYAFAKYVGGKRYAVCHDMRESSLPLTQALLRGINAAGCSVVNFGLNPTPALYFAVCHYNLDGGIVVTASHNPANYNGFKLCREQAIPLSADHGINEIRHIVELGEFPPATTPGSVENRDLAEDYLRHVLSFSTIKNPLKIVVDASNGMGGLYCKRLFEKLPCDLVPLYHELDGSFPNHEANPLKLENMEALIRTVKIAKADAGVMLDGDADRCAFVDEEGNPVPCDLITALLAREALSKQKGPVLYDVRSSWSVREEIAKYGGTPVEERVGHSFMKAAMRAKSAVFGGELSGHYYFRENFNCDSGEIAMLAVLNLLSNSNETLSQLIRPLQRYHSTGEINFTVEDKEATMKELAAAFPGAEVSRLDGITVRFKDWWFNVRPSNTEPVLRLNLEAANPILLEQQREKLYALLGEPE